MKVFNNSPYFDNISKLISKLLNIELTDSIENDDTYILFTVKDMKKIPKKYIVYNFEQLDTTNVLEQRFWDRIKNAIHIFDYSMVNVNYLHDIDISATFLPYGWNSTMLQTVKPYNERKNEILFIGMMNDRRREILRDTYNYCATNDYNIYITNDCWDSDYDRALRISKIGINIHYYEGHTILEVHRIIPYILNKIYVISERSSDTYYDTLFNDMVTWMDEPLSNHVIKAQNIENMEEILEYRKRKLVEKCSTNHVIKKLMIPYL